MPTIHGRGVRGETERERTEVNVEGPRVRKPPTSTITLMDGTRSFGDGPLVEVLVSKTSSETSPRGYSHEEVFPEPPARLDPYPRTEEDPTDHLSRPELETKVHPRH